MQITAEWAAVIVAGAVAAGTWLGSWRERKKASMPLVTWTGAHLHVANRLNEHLTIDQISANGQIYLGEYRTDDGGSMVPGSEVLAPSPYRPHWIVPASSERIWALMIFDARDTPTIRLTMSSSLRTLRSKRLTLRDNHSD